MEYKYNPKQFSRTLQISMENVYNAAAQWEKDKMSSSKYNLKNEVGYLISDLKIATFTHQISEKRRDEMKDYFLSLIAGK